MPPFQAIPATPGNFLIGLDPDDPKLPVVGWAACGGAKALPVVLGRFGGLVNGDAVEAASGHVLDLALGRVFDSAEEWRDHIAENEPYSVGMTNAALSYGAEPAAALSGPSAAAGGPLPVSPNVPPVGFGGKTYAKTTFWQAPAEDPSVVFVLEPKNSAPLTGAAKITRDTYYELRKAIPEVTIAAFATKTDEDQPDLPFDPGTTDADEDEDDGISMI